MNMTKSELKQIIKECVTEIMAEHNNGVICSRCGGSGEGRSDRDVCTKCGGSGDEEHPWGQKDQEPDPDDQRDARMDRD